VLEVLTPGLLSTVQDAGRPGWAHLGVPRAGACDPWSLAVANLLLGNPVEAAALEITLLGPELAVRGDGVVGLAGADLGAWVPEEERPLDPGRAHRLRAGTTVAFRGGAEGAGVRCYLALSGGIDVPVVLGSRSTCLAGAFGGLDGRALRPGDLLAPARADDPAAAGRRLPREARDALPGVRVVAGPHPELLTSDLLEALLATAWSVGAQSDRTGLRLEGAASLPVDASLGRMVSQPMVWGAVQVTPEGMPICLLADHQTVGGYPVATVVISADRPRIGQLGPGDEVTFSVVTLAEADAALRQQRERLAALAAMLGAPGRSAPSRR
jgi:biotin-dependent carboxylase-like uncharacterized protein